MKPPQSRLRSRREADYRECVSSTASHPIPAAMRASIRTVLSWLPEPVERWVRTMRDQARDLRGDLHRLRELGQPRRERMRFIAAWVLGREAVRLNLHGYDTWVRPATTDLRVAASCLGDEFDLPIRMLAGLREETVVLDLGGYIGTAAMKFAAEIPRCTVITVEPSPDNYRILLRNIAGQDNIRAVNVGVGRPGMRAIREGCAGKWGNTIMPPTGDRTAARQISQVQVLSMEEVIARYCKPGAPIALVKIDIEGAEIECLQDPAWMKQCAIVMIELHDRYVPGCSDSWRSANELTARQEYPDQGEKCVSVNPALLARLASGPERTPAH